MSETHLEPLAPDRARQLCQMMEEVQKDANNGLALDEQGRVLRVVEVRDTEVDHLLGDLDVHA